MTDQFNARLLRYGKFLYANSDIILCVICMAVCLVLLVLNW